MKRLTYRFKRGLILLFSTIFIAICSVYVLIQTPFGATALSRILSTGKYGVSFESVSYSLETPTHMTFHTATVTEKNSAVTLLNNSDITLTFTPGVLWHIGYFDTITVNNGELDFSGLEEAHSVIKTRQLSLQNTDIIFRSDARKIKATAVHGTITQFGQPYRNQMKPSLFSLTAERVNISELTVKNVSLSGSIDNTQLILSNMGGDIGGGFFLGSGKRSSGGDWYIDELTFSHLRLEDPKLIAFLSSPDSVSEKIHFSVITVTDSSANFPQLKLEKGNLELNNLGYDHGWSKDDLSLSFNADRMDWNGEVFHDPEIRFTSKDNRIDIKQASSRWRKGLVSFNGAVHEGNWKIETLTLSGMTLFFSEKSPEQLDALFELIHPICDLTIEKLTVTPSLLIDSRPDFPMQLSALRGRATDVVLIRHHQVGLWQGEGQFFADEGALNGIEIRYPELRISSVSENGSHSDNIPTFTFNTLSADGVLEGKVQSNVASGLISHLYLKGIGVSTKILNAWKLIQHPPLGDQFILNLTSEQDPEVFEGQLRLFTPSTTQSYRIKQDQLIP